MTRVGNTFEYGDNTYVQRSQASAEVGAILATVASAAVMKALPSFSNPFLKQMVKEHDKNHLYKDAFYKSVQNSNLKEKGLEVIDTFFSNSDKVKINMGLESEIVNKDIKAGLNACYAPGNRKIFLNADKATISGFHELGHAMNHLNSKTGRFLQALRRPGYALAGIMGTVAMFSRRKPKEANRDFQDFLQDNCGKIAFIGMLPTVIEESMASYKGVKMAKEAGLKEPLIKNLKKFYGKALLSYAGYAVVTGLSVFAASKIMEIFTRPKKVTTSYDSNFDNSFPSKSNTRRDFRSSFW